MKNPALTFAPLICFEDTLPDVADKARAVEAGFLRHHHQRRLVHRMVRGLGRAATSQPRNIPLRGARPSHDPLRPTPAFPVSSTKTAPFTDRLLGPSGAEIDVGGVFARTLEFYPARATLYESWGDWIVLLSSLASVMLWPSVFSPSPMNPDPTFSVVVPFYNEAENLPQPHSRNRRHAARSRSSRPKSSSSTTAAPTPSRSRPAALPSSSAGSTFSRNSGQSAAMYHGMQKARGEFIILMDRRSPERSHGRTENVPQTRGGKTGPRHRRAPPIATTRSCGVSPPRSPQRRPRRASPGPHQRHGLHAEGHSPRRPSQRLPGWNGMHRFMPALVLSAGYKIGEMPVEHRARFAGVSKVAGGKRALRATVDLFGMLWFSRRQFKGRLLEKKP